MKKISSIKIIPLFFFLLLVGCNHSTSQNYYEKEFGSYEIQDGWVESKTHSTDSKFFYVLDGTDNDEMPNNISINVGTNRYASKDHEQFKEAIVRQLTYQISNIEGATLNASGSYTDKGYVLYTFVIKEEKSTTTQYYIVGDYEYVLVHETVFDGSKEPDEVAKKIVNSFEWKEEK